MQIYSPNVLFLEVDAEKESTWRTYSFRDRLPCNFCEEILWEESVKKFLKNINRDG